MNKVRLKVLGLSYSQTQTGSYALILGEEQGQRKIPIVIGGFEAQAIAIELEKLRPPRPLTHDLFVNFAIAFKIEILEVVILKFEEGVFFSELLCDNGGTKIKIDARTSDAVSLAIRFGCPIYATNEIMDKAGIILPTEENEMEKALERKNNNDKSGGYGIYSLRELKDMLNKAIDEENYEEASNLRDEIKNRENNI